MIRFTTMLAAIPFFVAVPLALSCPTAKAKGGSQGFTVEGLPESKMVDRAGITLKSAANEILSKEVGERTKSPGGKGTVRLNFSGLELPENVGLRVYVNPPIGETLSGADSPSYVGTVSAFAEGKAKDYALDLAPILRKLLEKGQWKSSEPIVIRLVVVSLKSRAPVADAKVKLEKVTIDLP